jgi:excisionase family DNA binding protein
MTLTVPEAARRTGRNPETIRRWIRAGKLPARKVGTQHIIEVRDLDAVIAPDSKGGVERGHGLHEAAAPHLAGATNRPAAPTDPWLPLIVGRIVRMADPVRIVLFGSRARSDAREDSDYDLMVVVDVLTNRRAMCIAIRRSFHDLPVAADIVVATAEETDGRMPGRPAGVVYWALREGSVIYDRGVA